MIAAKIKKTAAAVFPQINAATEWIELSAPQCEVETPRGKFSVHAQRFGDFCGDYYSSFNICFVWSGDRAGVPAAKMTSPFPTPEPEREDSNG